ncbi:MAG: oligosaccharide flippase family protein [Acidobacteriia bacterium]|nr:oligosaccharide flippase family protein [Terriglobia bacterium]
MRPIANWKRRIIQSQIVRNTISMLAGGAVRLGLQAVYFVIIARLLGPSQYGAFVGAAALIGVVSPFAMLGTGNLMIQSVARDRTTFRESWGNALCMTGIASGALLILILLGSRLIFARGISLSLVALVGFSDLFLAGIVGVAGQAFQAFEQLHRTARLNVTLTGTRAVAALGLAIFVRHPDAALWARLYLLSTGVAAVYAFGCVQRYLGSPSVALGLLRHRMREGFYFSFSLSSASIYNNIDKPMLARLSTLDAVGMYATAYRVVDIAFQPVGALLASAYARFFRHGENGLAETTVFAKRLLPFSVSYGVFAGLGLVVGAPLLPKVVGHNYATAVEALWWLSPLVLLKSVHYFLADSLTGAGFQGHRTAVQAIIGFQNVLLNLWLIPAYGWRGAAWSSLESDAMLIVTLAATIVFLTRKQRSSGVTCRIEPEIVP